jgi:hypothetical protein
LPSKEARTIRARSTMRASSVRLLLIATKLAASSAEHSNKGACLGISKHFNTIMY